MTAGPSRVFKHDWRRPKKWLHLEKNLCFDISYKCLILAIFSLLFLYFFRKLVNLKLEKGYTFGDSVLNGYVPDKKEEIEEKVKNECDTNLSLGLSLIGEIR